MSIKAVRFSPELVLIHWPDQIFWGKPEHWRIWLRAIRVIAVLTAFRLRGVRLIWIVHNLAPHDLPPKSAAFWEWYVRILAKLTTGWLTLSPSTPQEVVRMIPPLRQRPRSFIWHPPYPWATPTTQGEARAALGFRDDEVVFGHIGLLRSYKGLLEFADSFARYQVDGARLVFAGMVKSDEYKRAIEDVGFSNKQIDLRFGPLDEQEYNKYLQAVDVFVAPYQHFLHSGAIIHALSRGCLVLTRDSVFARDLARAVGEEWVLRFHDEITTDILKVACAQARYLANYTPNLTLLQPEANVGRLRSFIEDLGVELERPSTQSVFGERSWESG